MSEYRNIGIWMSKTQEPVITQYLAGVNSPGFPVHTEFMVPHSSRKLKSLHWKFFLLWSANMSFYTIMGLTWVGHVLHIVQQILPGSRLNIYNKLMFLDSNMQYHMDLFFFYFLSQDVEVRYYCMLTIDKMTVLNKSCTCIFLSVRY